MRKIEHSFPWTMQSSWSWPVDDVKLLQVIDDVEDVDRILEHTAPERRRTVIQAGGACGIWPIRLSHEFQSVFTCEPVRENFECMDENIQASGAQNIAYGRFALGVDTSTRALMVQHPNEKQNAGSMQVDFVMPKLGEDPGDSVPVVRIDDLVDGNHNVDLIVLDLEGFEIFALAGGHQTIQRCRPVIVIEDKGLSQKYGHKKGYAPWWLQNTFGYHVARSIKRDLVMVPGEKI